MSGFLEALREQRWDDHRYYHHSRINQSLHLLSAISFVCAYVIVFKSPATAVLIAWLIGMTSRQAGHFFFEPRHYDEVNQATHDHKEEIKVGYNLQRKVVLMTIWALSPLALYVDPTLFGMFEPHTDTAGFVHNVALMWLTIGVGGLIFRTVHLFFLKDVQTGLVWATKIVTDPFHDIKLYYKAPLYLARGELIDPRHGQHHRRRGRRRGGYRAQATASDAGLLPSAKDGVVAKVHWSWSGLARPSIHRLAQVSMDGWILGTSPRMSSGVARSGLNQYRKGPTSPRALA